MPVYRTTWEIARTSTGHGGGTNPCQSAELQPERTPPGFMIFNCVLCVQDSGEMSQRLRAVG